MLVLQPLLRHYRDNYHFQRSRVANVVLFMVIWVGMHTPYVLYIAVVCVVIQCHASLRGSGNPLAALGCQLVEGVLYVSKLPVTTDGKVSTSAT